MRGPWLTWVPVIALLALVAVLGMFGYILGVSLVLHIAHTVRVS